MLLIIRFLLLSLYVMTLTACSRSEQKVSDKVFTPYDPSGDAQYSTYIFGKGPITAGAASLNCQL